MAGLTQAEFAKTLEISTGFLSDAENGKNMPGGETLFRVSRKFGVSLDWLVTGEGEPLQGAGTLAKFREDKLAKKMAGQFGGYDKVIKDFEEFLLFKSFQAQKTKQLDFADVLKEPTIDLPPIYSKEDAAKHKKRPKSDEDHIESFEPIPISLPDFDNNAEWDSVIQNVTRRVIDFALEAVESGILKSGKRISLKSKAILLTLAIKQFAVLMRPPNEEQWKDAFLQIEEMVRWSAISGPLAGK